MHFKRRLSGIGLAFLLWGIMLSSQIVGITSASARQGNTLVKPDLSVILKATAEYSRKLENVIFDFTCLEEVKETIDPLLDVLRPFEMARDWTRVFSGAGQPLKIRNTFSYDYQCIRQGGKIREKRILLEENRKKKMFRMRSCKPRVLYSGTLCLRRYRYSPNGISRTMIIRSPGPRKSIKSWPLSSKPNKRRAPIAQDALTAKRGSIRPRPKFSRSNGVKRTSAIGSCS